MAQAKKATRSTLDQEVELVRATYYGDPGKGKTTALAAMAQLGKVIYIDAENGLKKKPLANLGIPLDNIEPRREISYEALMDLGLEIQERMKEGEPIIGLVWDSVTETYRVLLEQLVNSSVASAAAKGMERNAWRTYLEDYGDMTEQMRRILRRFRDLPIHLGIAALSKRDQDEEGAVRVSPGITPGFQRDLMGYSDIVLHCRMELIADEEEYSALTRPVGRFEAKDRFGMLPRVLVNPSFPRVVDYINGKLTSANDPAQQAAKAKRQAAEEATAAAPVPA